MQFNQHRNQYGLHAPFTASQPSWLRYDDEKAIEVYNNRRAAEMGTLLHKWAQDTINLKIKQPRSKKTLYAFVNDAIGFGLSTEVVLLYSERFFGTADAIGFRNNTLRIHDLKTGVNPAKMEQLMVYAALFCLEYRMKPNEIEIELRIYQNDDIDICNPDPEDIKYIMDKIVHFDNLLEKMMDEEA